MAKLRIKKGDTVQVIAGRRTKTLADGTSIEGDRGKTGGIITQEAPIHLSNVALVDPETKKRTRVGIRVETVERDGRTKRVRIRIARRSGKDI